MADASSSSPPSPPTQEEKAKNPWNWNSYTADDLKRSVSESTDSALRSARSLHENSSTHLQTVQDFIPTAKSQYKSYEDTFFKKVKDELMSAREHPTIAAGLAITTGLLLMRGTRRFLYRQTLGRFQSEEAQFNKAERNVMELNRAVDMMKMESKKLLERAALAEEEMKRGHTQVMNAGGDIRRLTKSVYRVESQATGMFLVVITKKRVKFYNRRFNGPPTGNPWQRGLAAPSRGCFDGLTCETTTDCLGQKGSKDFRFRSASMTYRMRSYPFLSQ